MLSGVVFSQDVHIGVWFCLGAIFLASLATAVVAVRRRQAVWVFISGLLLVAIANTAWMGWGFGTATALIEINAFSLAVGSAVWTLIGLIHPSGVPHAGFGGRQLVFSHLAAKLAVALMGLAVSIGVVREVMELPQADPQLLDWIALAATWGAVAICLWDRMAKFPLAGLYALVLAAICLEQVARFSPGKFFVWAASAEYAGFVYVTALIGWALRRFKPSGARLRIPNAPTRWSGRWFSRTQVFIIAVIAVLAAWISIDSSFDALGKRGELLDVPGRFTAFPVALMLVGATAAMAWQTTGVSRARWQYATLAIGLLCTSSLGWAQIDAGAGNTGDDALWLQYSVSLLITSSMMTVFSRFGIARIVSRGSDWIARGRKSTPVFGVLALLMLAIVVLMKTVAVASPS